jgi:steroid delta-isomerase-like uncharacterized protein
MGTTASSRREENEAVVREFVRRVWQEKDVEAMDELFTADSVLHDPSGDRRGVDSFKEYNRRYHEAFPDLEYEVRDVVADADRVAFRARMRGTLEGEFRGFDPTGESFEAEGIVIARIEDGRIAERWASYDALGMLRQLGLLDAASE